MTVFLACVIHVTLMLALGIIIGASLVRRAPATVARIGSVCIYLCVLVLAMHALEIPRPFQLDLRDPVTLPRSPEGTSMDPPTAFGEADRHSGFGRGVWIAARMLPGLPFSDEPVESKRTAAPLLWIWLSALAWSSIRLVIGTVALLQIRRESRPLRDDSLKSMLGSLATVHNIENVPSVRESALVKSPCVTWLDKGEIYVPESFQAWSPGEQRAALVHELAHVVRGDARIRILVDICFAFLWLHPLAHVLRRQFILGQESASDRLAVSFLGGRQSYRESLSKMALRLHDQVIGFSPSLRVSFSNNDLIRRIKMLSSTKSPLKQWHECFLFGLVICGAGALSLVSTAADPVERIASLPRNSETDINGFFQRGVSQPWDHLGESDSYFRVEVRDLVANQKLKETLDGMHKFLFSSSMDPADFSFANDLSQLMSNMKFETKRLDGDNPEGNRWSMQAGATAFHFKFGRPFDMGKLDANVRWEALGPPDSEATKWIRSAMQSAGMSQTLVLGQCNPPEGQDIAKRLWKVVDGGAIAAVTRVDTSFQSMTPQERAEEDPFGLLETFSNSEFVSLGVDLRPGESDWAVRIAVLANAESDVSEMKRQWEALQADFDNMTAGLLRRMGEQAGDLSGDERAILEFIESSRVSLVSLPEVEASIDAVNASQETNRHTGESQEGLPRRLILIEGTLDSELLLSDL